MSIFKSKQLNIYEKTKEAVTDRYIFAEFAGILMINTAVSTCKT